MMLKFRSLVLVILGCTSTSVGLFSQAVRINELNAFSENLSIYKRPLGVSWKSSAFNDEDWGTTTFPIGMDRDNDYQLPANLYSEIFPNATSLYARSEFTVDPLTAESNAPVTLSVDYDDAFILFINGKEVARGNIGIPGIFVGHDEISSGTHRASNDNGDGLDHSEEIDLGPASGFLAPGINTIAVQIHNQSLSSSDMYLDLSLIVDQRVLTDDFMEVKYLVGISEPDQAESYPDLESDWIELYNPSDEVIHLEGWTLTDDQDDPGKWTFPPVSIDPQGYLLVLASGGELPGEVPWEQAFFKLSSSGEYLGLYDPDGRVVSELSPAFPAQVSGTSLGWDADSGTYRITPEKTPGWSNVGGDYDGKVGDTSFSHDRGFYDDPFVVEISSSTEGASIRYTIDGSKPSDEHGILYAAPVEINTTTVLRAMAYKDGFLPTNVDTHTYLFLNDVVKQGNTPEGYPTTWKSNEGKQDLPADYEMDSEVTEDPLYKDKMREALLSIPTISLVTNIEHLFDRDTGIYQNPQQHGPAWERPASIEWIFPNGKKGIQIDCGMRAQGGHTRDPERMPKRSFRLAFRKEYGKGELGFPVFSEPDATEEIDTIILRGSANQSWLHHNGFRGDNRARAQYVRDQFTKKMQGRMGWPYLHNNYAFLYVNGIFWGLYNPTERATNQFGASYLGGEEEDYDAINSGEIIDGDNQRWKELKDLALSSLTIEDNYQRISEILDLEQFTDYMLLNHWGGNEDWDHHNWYALGNREDGKFQFYTWDSEFIFEEWNSNTTLKSTTHHPGGIFHSLLNNREYKQLAADRIYKHFFNGGALTTEVAIEEWNELSANVYHALIGESARWGDYRRDVHRRTGPYLLYTRDDQWVKERRRLLEELIPARNEVTHAQLSLLGLVPKTPVPEMSNLSGALSEDNPLILSIPDVRGAEIYYTMDGSDPRLYGGEVSPTAILYNDPIHVSERTTIKVRVKDWSGWSPLREGKFHPEGDPVDLVISEIFYAPLPAAETSGKDLEFIEIHNAGPAPIPLDGLLLSEGIKFSFPDGLVLQPESCVLVVGDLEEFAERNPDLAVAGEYSGSLSNLGELVTLEHETLGLIQQVVYSNWYPWPAKAAEEGHSLVPINSRKKPRATHSTAWRASKVPGGSPGREDIGQPGWIFHPNYGWVYSESGETGPGNWLWGLSGFFYVGSDDASGAWLWIPKPSSPGN